MENLDLSKYENMSPADFGIDIEDMKNLGPSVMGSPQIPQNEGPPRPCEPNENAEETSCITQDRVIYYRGFPDKLAEWLSSSSYSVSTHQFARDCVFASSGVSFDRQPHEAEAKANTRPIHNSKFWAQALSVTQHGRTPESMMSEMQAGDTAISKILFSETADPTKTPTNPVIRAYYNDCDRVRERLGGAGEAYIPDNRVSIMELR